VILAHGLDPQQVFMHYYQGKLAVTISTVARLSEAEVDVALSKMIDGCGACGWCTIRQPRPSVLVGESRWLADRTRYGNENLTLSMYGLPGLPQLEVSQHVAFGPELLLTDLVVAVAPGMALSSRWRPAGASRQPGTSSSLRQVSPSASAC
jgi:hypothetical protein